MALSTGWAREVTAILGGDDVELAEPWLDLAERAGPTPWSGPLRHDWLLPRGDRKLGLNVFCEPALAHAFDAAVTETARAIGGAAPAQAAALLAIPARWSGGLLVDADGPRLKLYATDRLEAVAAALDLDADAVAFGVDVTARGRERARSYHPARPDPSWPRAATWLAHPFPGESHRLLARLEGAAWKRSFDLIFGPEATLDDLRATATASAALDDAFASCIAIGQLARLAAVAHRLGLVLRPVAYELDVYADGHRTTDALVTLGAP